MAVNVLELLDNSLHGLRQLFCGSSFQICFAAGNVSAKVGAAVAKDNSQVNTAFYGVRKDLLIGGKETGSGGCNKIKICGIFQILFEFLF